MYIVNEDNSIYVTRGDIVAISVTANDDGAAYKFKAGDILRINVHGRKECDNVVLQKDFPIAVDTESVDIFLDEKDTKIGESISKPKDYWYEIVLNPDTNPQTIIGYDDENCPIVFKLFPEGGDIEVDDEPITPEDIPIVDENLDISSSKPVENKAIAREILRLDGAIKSANKSLAETNSNVSTVHNELKQEISVERARITNLATLGEGSTTGDAELIDLRVGADGVVDATAGESVRRQFNNIVGDLLVKTPIFDPKRALNSSGNTIISASWATSDYIPVFANVRFTIEAYAGMVCFYKIDKTPYEGEGAYNPVNASPFVEYGRSFCVDFDGYMRFVILSNGSEYAADPSAVVIRYHKSKLNSKVNNPLDNTFVLPNRIEGRHFGKRLLCKFNELKNESGVYSEGGSVAANDAYSRCVEYIPVREMSVYWIRKMYQVSGHFYDADKNYIGTLKRVANSDDGVWMTENAVFITPKDACYLRINAAKDDINIQCVGYGDTPLTDEQIATESSAKVEASWIKADILDSVKERIGCDVWLGKSFATFGDSITWQDGKTYSQGDNIGEIARGYQTIIKEKCGFSSYDNYGVSGAPMASGSANGKGTVDTIEETDLTDKNYDLVIIAAGTNDFKLNIPIGIDNGDITTFYGAYCRSVERLINANINTRIVLLTPLHRNNGGYDDEFTNKAGHNLKDYVNAIRSIGEKYSLPVCDMYANSGINAINLANFTIDGLHPNDTGYARMGAYCSAFLKTV